MIGYYNYTVILTYIGTLFGFIGVTYTWSGNLKMALICLIGAGFCDMFDGRIASTRDRTKQEKRFGIQIDSLSDLICFGVLPALIALQSAHEKTVHIIMAAVYLLCALIRLAWFNVDEEERQTQEAGSRETYLGLPVTTSALIVPFVMGAGQYFNLPVAQYLSWLLLGIAVAFVSPFHLKKPGLIGKIIMVFFGAASFILVMMGVGV